MSKKRRQYFKIQRKALLYLRVKAFKNPIQLHSKSKLPLEINLSRSKIELCSVRSLFEIEIEVGKQNVREHR